jgi:hypothetical protein
MQTEPAKRIGADLDAGPAMPSTIRTWPQARLQVMVAQSGSARFMTMMMHGHVTVGQGLGWAGHQAPQPFVDRGAVDRGLIADGHLP